MLKILFLLIFLFLLIKGDDINIDLDDDTDLSSGTGFTFENDIITIITSGTYTFTGYSFKKSIIISSTPVIINFDYIQIELRGERTPLRISENCQVTLNLKNINQLSHYSDNENNGVIYMESGAKLIISSEENENPTLSLKTYKGFIIYGEQSTNLNINNNIKIGLLSYSFSNRGIYIGNDIIINGGEMKDNIKFENKGNPSIKAGGSIFIKKGSFELHSIQAEKSIILGEKGMNNDLEISIETKDEGIKAKNIEIYSCQIEIFSIKESLISNGDIIINNAMLKIYAGTYDVISSPIKYGGKLEIVEAYMMVCSKNCSGVFEIITNKQSYSHFGKYITQENPVNIRSGIYSVEEFNEKNSFSCFLTYPNKDIDIGLYVNFENFKSYENNKCPIDRTDIVNEVNNYSDEFINENNNDKSEGWENSEFRKISYLSIFICLMLIK